MIDRARRSSRLLVLLLPLVFLTALPSAARSQPLVVRPVLDWRAQAPAGPPPSGAPSPAAPTPTAPSAPALTPTVPGAIPPSQTVPNPTTPVVPLPGLPPERQPAPPPAMVPSGPRAPDVPVGPYAPTGAPIELRPSVAFTEEYSDNFDLRRNGRSNWRTSVSPALTLLLRRGLTEGSLSYQPAASHDTVSDEFNLFHSLAAAVRWLATPTLTLSASDTFTRSDEPDRAERLALRRERRTFTSNAFSVAGDHVFQNLGTRGYYRLSTFSDSERGDTISHAVGGNATATLYETNSATLGYEFLDSSTGEGQDIRGHQLAVSLARQLTSLATAGVSGSYQLRSASGPGARDFDSWSASVFGGYGIPGHWSLNASVGVSRLSDDGRDDKFAVTTATGFTYEFARAKATIGLERGFSETFREGENFGVVETQGITGSLTYPLPPAIVARLSAEYRENKGTGIGLDPGVSRERRENAWSVGLDLTVRLLEWLEMVLAASHRELDAPSPEGYTENRVRVSLGARF